MIHAFPHSSCFFAAVLSLVMTSSNIFAEQEKRIVFVGDSITAGYGLKKEEAYPKLIEGLAAAKGMKVKTVNAGLSGDTTSGGLRRLSVLVKKPADLFVIALGGNDGLRGLPPKTSGENLSAMIDLIKKQQPKAHILLVGMQMPANMGKKYNEQFTQTFSRVATSKQIAYLPFLLEGIAGKKEYNLPDRIHPNAEGQKIVAEHIYAAIEKILSDSKS